jgi:hypothetical protein
VGTVSTELRTVNASALRRVASSKLGSAVLECVIVVAVFAAAQDWGRTYWNRSLAAGRHPGFYQLYFEPAVMVACGKGFVVTDPQPPAIGRFLKETTATFDCNDIPSDAVMVSAGGFQATARYLMLAVAWTWRSVGVSFRKLGPLAGLLFGLTITASYGIFRLGMGRVLAVLCACGLSLSPLHLLNLPGLRDYSKAPFLLLLVFLFGLLVTRRPSWRSVLLTSVASGVVLGIGYGFRYDLLIAIPGFLLAMSCLDAGWRDRLKYGSAGTALFLATFYACAWPVIEAVRHSWDCRWHTMVIGLGAPQTKDLQLRESAYDWFAGFSDEFVYATTTSYAARVQPGLGHIEYCGPAYDDVTRSFVLDVARHTPADFFVRAYASSLQMVQLPFRWRAAPIPDVAGQYYRIRDAITSQVTEAGLFLVMAAVFLITAGSKRLGLFVVAFLLYFGGYPAGQFHDRHFFHLEFITWWALGFLLQQFATAIAARVSKHPVALPSASALRRAALLLGGCAATLWLALVIARLYQARSMTSLIQQYATADVERIDTEVADGLYRVPVAPRTQTDPETADLIAVDLNEWQCSADSKLTFVYDRSHLGFGPEVAIRRDLTHAKTRVFVPVYATFQGVSLGRTAPAPGCLAGLYRARYPERFALMPQVTLRPGWESEPVHQSLIGWGLEPPPDD